MKKVWYKCDSAKNKDCKKTSCKFNEKSDFKVCDRTSHIEFSVDGIPINEENEEEAAGQ